MVMSNIFADVSRIVAFVVKNIDTIFFCTFHFFTRRNLEKNEGINIKKAAWAYVWAGMNTGMPIHVQLRVRL